MGVYRRTLNIWVARTMPVLMAGIVGFATWVFLSLVCGKFFLPPQEPPSCSSLTRILPVHHLLLRLERTATAAILIVIYTVLLLLLATSYLRTVVTLTVNPGYVPKGPPRDVAPTGSRQQLDGVEDGYSETGSRSTGVTAVPASVNSTEGLSPFPPPGPPAATAASDRLSVDPSDPVPQTPNSTRLLNLNPPRRHSAHSPNSSNGMQGRPYTFSPRPQPNSGPLNLRDFLDKEIFVCEGDGLPRYCSKCNCWKPDRSHHCSEIERCVWRMDHFCPWYFHTPRGRTEC